MVAVFSGEFHASAIYQDTICIRIRGHFLHVKRGEFAENSNLANPYAGSVRFALFFTDNFVVVG